MERKCGVTPRFLIGKRRYRPVKMPLNRLLSWDRANGIAMALEHGYPMKPFSMQSTAPIPSQVPTHFAF